LRSGFPAVRERKVMGKYLLEADYVGPGIAGLIREGGSRRRAAVAELFKSMGGSLEAFYYAFGEHDVLAIGELPDDATAMALALRINASGAAACRVTVLVMPEALDQSVRKTGRYRAPGANAEQAELAKWDDEGGHPAPEDESDDIP
jgi:uncharacterized protein with GYD domain